MPQSQEFWRYARQMREYESEAPEDERVYLCILRLAGKGGKDSDSESDIANVTSRRRHDLNQLQHIDSFEDLADHGKRRASTNSTDIDPRQLPASSDTPASPLRKRLGLSKPQIVKKWHEIGTLKRHWATEVRGNVYELHREEENNRSTFRKRTVTQVDQMRKRLTARLYVGRTHMTDDVILAIAKGLIHLQRDYDLQMDNCQHFAAVLIPRILCAYHCHMTVLPSASLPYVKHSEFGNLQVGAMPGKLSEIYHRYLHSTRNLVWQQSAYYFDIRKNFQPNCELIDTNPYRAVVRLIQGNVARPRSKKCSNQDEKQRGVAWNPEGGFEELNEDRQKQIFPTAKHPPKARTFGVWAMHHIREGTEAILWTPQMFNEWLEANEANCSLLIKFPDRYFSKLRPQPSTVSLDIQNPGDTTICRQAVVRSPWSQQHSSRLFHPLEGARPRVDSTWSMASYDSRPSSRWSAASLDALSTYASAPSSTTGNLENVIPDTDGQCVCAKCLELDEELAQAIELSERETAIYNQRQMLEDEDMAIAMRNDLERMQLESAEISCSEDADLATALAMSENERVNNLSRAVSEDQAFAASLQSAMEQSAIQQLRDDEELARQLSEDATEPTTQTPVVAISPVRHSSSEASLDSLYSSSVRRGSSRVPSPLRSVVSAFDGPANSPLRSEIPSAFDVPAGPPSYEASLSGCSTLPSYAAAPA